MNEIEVKKLYNALIQKGYTIDQIGNENTFLNNMNDENKRRDLYEYVSSKGNFKIGDYDTYESRLTSSIEQSRDNITAQPANPVEDVKQDYPPKYTPRTEEVKEIEMMTEQGTEYATGFGQGFRQGIKGLGHGIQHFGGEVLNLFTGSTIDEEKALERIAELELDGIDIESAIAPLDKVQRQVYETTLSNGDVQLSGITDEQKQYAQMALEKDAINKTIREYIEKAGSLEEAKSMLAVRANEETQGDKWIKQAAKGLAELKPTKGFGAWVGNLAPQMIPAAVSIGVGAVTKNPKLTQGIGMAGMSAMTVSTAGMSMNEAREAGATGLQTWAVGIADGAIEFATEKIPFNRYTSRVLSGVKKKVGSDLSEAITNSPQARNELERLLQEANKRLGGKLFNGKNVKDFAGDIVAEGLSEFTAEALQTITPMIYENPEDYPTIGEILRNGWEGAKAGVFMGSVLGGSSKTMEHYQQRNRRKEQGFVDIVEFETEDGYKIGESLGMTDRGVAVITDGKIQYVIPEDIIYDHKFSFEEFDRAELQMENEESFDNGYSLSEQQEMNDAKNMLEVKKAEMIRTFGFTDESDIEAFLGENPIETVAQRRQNGESEESTQTIIDYLNAKATYDGMSQRVRDDIDGQIEQSNALIDSHTNKHTGKIHGAVSKEDGRLVYIVSGNVVPHQDGSGIDLQNSDENIIIRDAETGELKQMSPEFLSSLYDTQDPNEQKEINAQQIREKILSEESNKIDGVVDFNDKEQFLNEAANKIAITIILAQRGLDADYIKTFLGNAQIVENPDGTLTFTDGQNEVVVPKQEIQQQVDANNMQRAVDFNDKAKEMRNAIQQATAATTTLSYGMGDNVSLRDTDGNIINGTISMIEDDTYVIDYSDNNGTWHTLDLTQQELDNMIVGHNGSTLNQPVSEQMTVEETTEIKNDDAREETTLISQATISSIPKDESGNPIYEQADSETAWDALIEDAEGDEMMAGEVAKSMIADKEAELKKLEKSKIKEGKTPAEKMAALKERKAEVEKIKQDIEAWKKIAFVPIRRQIAQDKRIHQEEAEAAAKRKAEEERLMAERQKMDLTELEKLDGTPDIIDDIPNNARLRGYRRVNGHLVERQQPIQAIQGKETDVEFSNDVRPKGHYAVIDASQLQPSHIQGNRNPLHFLDEAQPKERNDEASIVSAQKIAGNIRPATITTGETAYVGTPTINTRGEVIQGNSRSDALRLMWNNHQEQGQKYKQHLIDNAEQFGLNPEDVSNMENPVLVRMLDVNDELAITLGQYVAQDTESGGIERIKPKNTVKKMGNDIGTYANLLLNGNNEDMSFAELLDNNGVEVLKWMAQKGYITPTQYDSQFDTKGNLTAEAKNDLRGIMYQSIFEGGNTRLEEMFNALPAKAQKAILATAHRDFNSPNSERMIEEIQNSIRAFYALMQDEQFAKAKNFKDATKVVEAWQKQYQMDDVTGEGYLPSEKFSNFALHLAKMYKGEKQSNIQGVFAELYDLIQGTKEDNLFEQADKTPRTLIQAIKEVLNIDYNGQRRNNVLGGDNKTSQQGQHGRTGDVASRERTESGEQSANDSGRTDEDSGSSTFEIYRQAKNESGDLRTAQTVHQSRSERKRPEQTPDVGRKGDSTGVADDATQEVLGASNRGDIRVLEEGLDTSYRAYSDDSERTRRTAESERLVNLAKQHGLFVPAEVTKTFTDKVRKRTGESVVYIDTAAGKVTKVKDPYAKSAMKSGVQPEDAAFEHLVHNLLFPETAYTLEGISEEMGDVRIVLSQDFIQNYDQPTREQIAEALATRGLFPEDNYSFGNELVSVTDVEGDNVLLGEDGTVYFIDPIIRFKKPLREILAALGGAEQKAPTIGEQIQNTKDETSTTPIQGYSYDEIIETVKDEITDIISDNEIEGVDIKEIWAHGSRMRGDSKSDSDLDIVMFYEGDAREDDLFNLISESNLAIEGIKIDVNPIRVSSHKDIEAYKKKSKQYDEEKKASTIGERILAAEKEVNTSPTDKQKEAGNYKKGHVQIGTFNVTIEQPKGSVRSGVDANGKKWETTMHNTYGYIRGTEGVDGDHIDVFLSNDIDGWNGNKIFVVDQYNEDGTFDEHKVMLGFNDIEEAESAYLDNYEKGWEKKHKIVVSPIHTEEFEKWINSSHRKTKAFAEYKSVQVSEKRTNDSEKRQQLSKFNVGDIVLDYYNKKLYRIKKHSPNGVSTIAKLDEEGNEVSTTQINAHNNARYSLAEAPVKVETPTISQESEQVSDQDNAPYTINPTQYTTKKGKVLDMHLVKFAGTLTKEQQRAAKELAKAEKGWYDREQGGFMMRSEESAKHLADTILNNDDAVSDAQPVSLADTRKIVETEQQVQPTNPSGNRLVTDERYAELCERMRKKLGGQMNIGIDPEILAIGTEMAVYHLEKGARKFTEYAKAMIADLGDAIRPYLKAFYNGARNLPEVEGSEIAADMTPYDEVQQFNVATFDKEHSDPFTTAEIVVAEQAHQEEAEQAKQEIINQRNTERRQEDEQTSANTEAIASQAEVVADKAESDIETATTEEQLNDVVATIDKQIEEVNKQLALLGYYEADIDDSQFHESYGYMRSAERKAVKDADTLAKRIVKDLGIDPATIVDKKGKKRKVIAQANIAPAGGDISIRLPLTASRELYIDVLLEPDYEGGNRDNLFIDHIYLRIEDPTAGGYKQFVGRNVWVQFDATYTDMLDEIRAEIIQHVPEFDLPTRQSVSDTEQKQPKAKKSKKKAVNLQQSGELGLFDNLFDNETNNEDGLQRIDATRSEGVSANGNRHEQGLSRGSETGSESEQQDSRETDNGRETTGNAVDRTVRPRLSDTVEDKGIEGKRKKDVENNRKIADELKGVTLFVPDTFGVEHELSGFTYYELENVFHFTDNINGQRNATRKELDAILKIARKNNGKEEISEPKNTRNNHSERGKDHAPTSVDARIEANIKAIELAKQLLENGEEATKEQMEILRKFSGWGGLGKAFSEGTSYAPNNISKRLRELLGEAAYQEAIMSANSAYYTPAYVVDTLWDIAEQMGFKGGNILEGSAGIGNILGQMPTHISERSDIHAIEIDGTSGSILSLLYPDAKVEIQGFEETRIANGSVDLAITNVPFVTGLRVNDTTGDNDLSKKFHNIHDFCIAKNVRKLREGGLGIFITSNGTLDNSKKLRDWIVNEGGADFVGAFRMHNKTFGGTGVTSDIIVIRKRVNGKKSASAIDVSTVTGERMAEYETGETRKVKGMETPVIKQISMDYNRYFVEHPENMAGEMHFAFEKGDTFRPTSKGLYPIQDKKQEQMLSDFVQSFTAEEFGRRNEDDKKNSFAQAMEGKKLGEMFVNDGELYTYTMQGAQPISANANKVKGHTKVECFKAYSAIKEALAEVLAYQTENENDEGLQALLDNLNKAYDDFVATYGHFNKNTSIAFLRNDVDYANVFALEKYEETGDAQGNKVQHFGKTDVFSKRVVEKDKEPTPTNVKDGIIASIFKFGRVDVPYIAEQLGKSEAEIKIEIIESGYGFEDPATRQVEVSYLYLSGNVREKLRQAEENNENGMFERNIKALQDVIPMTIPAHLIDFTLGSSWIDNKLYEEYVKERTDVEVQFTAVGGTWFMKEPYRISYEKNRAMGVSSEMLGKTIMGHTLIEAAITNKSITVSSIKKNWDGSTETIVDKEATQACAAKIDEIRQDFKDWARQKMQSDAEMNERMERIYNETFNNYVPMSIPDEFVPEYFSGSSHKFKMRPHQGRAIVRGTMQPLLLAHEVGTGKTFTLISTAMEMRRLGTARKPMIVVQNATVGQFVASAKELYPKAKILTLEEADRSAEGRKNFYAKIRYNDWDMIVVPQSTFEFIPDSEERQMAFIQDKIEEKMLILEQMKEEDPDGKSMITKQAEREIALLEEELAELSDTTGKKRSANDEKKRAIALQNAEVKAMEMLDRRTDDVENFDDMGIDALLIDEAHEYKHLGFATVMQRGVKGVDPSYSKKSQGVFLKAQAVLEKNNGRNVIFATGTPISNTAAEIWTFMRYLMPADTMKEYGIYYFDDFVRNFGNIQQMLEFTTSGKFKENNRFAGYVNLPELVRIWSGVSDTVLTKEAGGVKDKIPEMEEGKAQDIYLPQTRALRSIMKFVKARLEEYDQMSGKQKKENSHIPLTMYGIAKAAAVDARLVEEDAEDDPNSKTNEAVRQTLRSLKETKDYKGTVAIFADNYQNKHTGFNLYDDIRTKLIAEGVNENEIVVIKSGMTVKKKLEIFEKVNRGEIRVILGSTFTLGTGVNIQERLHTLIHLDAPNRPMDYTQRNGRILRQGNIHKEMGKPVRVLRFGVEDSLDVTAYQRLKTKGAIADSIMNGKQMMSDSMNNRVLEEEEDVFGDTVAQLSGSEYAMLKNNAEKNVRKYQSRKKQWEADQTYIHNAKPRIKGLIKDAETRIELNSRNLKEVQSAFPDGKFKEIAIGKKRFATVESMEDFFKEYNKSIIADTKKIKDGEMSGNQTRELTIQIGDYSFIVKTELTKEYSGKGMNLFAEVHRKMTYSCPQLGIEDAPVRQALLRNGVEDIVGNVITGKDFAERLESAERSKDHNESELEQLMSREGKPFEYEKELEQAKKQFIEYSELMKKEMAEKEAKYAEMDASVESATDISNTEEDDDVLYRSDDDYNNIPLSETRLRKLKNGETSKIERIFTENKFFDFTSGEKIESADDVAYIFKQLEDESVENAFAVLVKDEKPTVIHLGMGDYTATRLNGSALHVAIERMDPDKVYFIHNHPSGNLTASTQDKNMLNELRNSYGNIIEDGIIINLRSGKYATFSDNGSTIHDEKNIENALPVKVFSFNKQVFDDDYNPNELFQVRSSSDVAQFISSHRLGGRPKLGILVYNHQLGIVGNIFTQYTKITKENAKNIAKDIVYYTTSMGGTCSMLFGNAKVKDIDNKGISRYVQRYSTGSIKLLDYINVKEDGFYDSAHEDGFLFRNNKNKKNTRAQRKQMIEHVEDLAKRLHLDNIEIVNSVSGLEGKKKGAKGFFSKKSGKITIVVPNHTSIADIEKTLLHEAVAHYGLRKLFGKHFDTFLDNVYNNVEESIRKHIAELAIKKYNYDFRKATEEYLASLAERTNFENIQQSSWWQKIKDFFADMLSKLGFKDFRGVTLTDNELRYILWRSYENLSSNKHNGIFGEATDIAKQYELGTGEFENNSDVMFRDGDPEIHEKALVRDKYDRRVKTGWYQSKEAMQDSMLSLKEAMKDIAGVEIEDIDGYENAYLGENRLSSVNKAEADAFAKLLFKPMLDKVSSLAKNTAEREELIDYMFAKHGLERNKYMRQQALQNGEDTDRDFAGLTALTGMDNVADAEAEAQRMVDEYEQGHNTTELWDKVNAVSKAILQKSFECGLMSEDTFNEISNMYKFYIPLRGFDEKTTADTYAYLSYKHSSFNAPVKKAEGRSSKADDPFAYLQSMAESTIMQGNRNKLVKQRFLNFVLNHPSDLVSVSDLWLEYDKINDEWKPVFPDNINTDDSGETVEQKIKDFEEKMELLAQNEPGRYKKGRDAIGIPYRVIEKRDLQQHQVIVKRNGRDVVLTINGNPRLAQALNGQTNPDNDMSGAIGAILRTGEKMNRQLSAFYTTRNPDFIVSNFMRDMLYTNSMAWIKESPNYALRFHRNYLMVNPVTMKRLLAKYRKGTLDMSNRTEAMFHQFMMNGGETGYANIRDIEQHKNDIRKELKRANGKLKLARAWSLLAEKFDELNRAVENCARFAAFVTSREMGRSIDRAIYDAKEISVNFNKKGSGAKFYDSVGQTKAGNASALVSGLGRSSYVFWNAAIQGTTNFGRQVKRHPAKAFTGIATMFILGALMAYLGMDDDEEDNKNSYYNLPEYVRRSNILFRTGEHWISIPLPVEYRAIYGLGELMISTISGKEHYTNSEFAEAIIGQMTQVLPLDFMEGGGGLNTIIPSAAKPLWEAYVTEKTWTGMPIYKDTPYNKNMPEWTKAYKSANKHIVGLAQALNEATGGDRYTKGNIDINPAKIEYILKGYFGGVFSTVDKMAKMAETAVGKRGYDPQNFLLLNRVVKAGDERTEYRAVNNEYFRLKEEYENLKSRIRNYEKDTYNGIFDYANKIDFLYNSPEYQRYEIFELYKKEIESLNDMIKNTYDNDERKELETYLNEIKKEMIEEMNKTRKRA